MLKRLMVLACLFLALLSLTGCIWAIGADRESLAVGLGSTGLVAFVAVWLLALPSALSQP